MTGPEAIGPSPWRAYVRIGIITGAILLAGFLLFVFMPEIAAAGMKWNWSRPYAEKTLCACGARAINQLIRETWLDPDIRSDRTAKPTELVRAICKRAEENDAFRHYLLGKLRDPDQADGTRWTLLHQAAFAGHVKLARDLIDRGATTDAIEFSQQRTPLHLAIGQRHDAITDLLLANGADVEKGDFAGRTPLYYAMGDGTDACIAHLLARGADTEVKDRWGNTPLYRTMETGRLDRAALLLDRGANVNSLNGKGWTVLDLAVSWNNDRMVDFLREHGAKTGAELKARAPQPAPAGEIR